MQLEPRQKVDAVDARQQGTVIQVAWPGKGVSDALGWARVVDPVSGKPGLEPDLHGDETRSEVGNSKRAGDHSEAPPRKRAHLQ